MACANSRARLERLPLIKEQHSFTMPIEQPISEAYQRMPSTVQGEFLLIETDRGTECVPSDVVPQGADLSEFTEGDVMDFVIEDGWGVRVSATSWLFFRDEWSARECANARVIA